jgi:Excinuclease ATPase subunit
MTNADYLIDLGPKGGAAGGKLMAAGKPSELVKNASSLTIDYLKEHFQKFNL